MPKHIYDLNPKLKPKPKTTPKPKGRPKSGSKETPKS